MQTIQQLIDLALVPKPRERSGLFTPSSFGKCFRAQIWRRRQEPESNPPDARTLRVFKAGNLFEQFVKDALLASKNGWSAVGDIPITTQPDIIGYADLDNPTQDEVADVKSQHSKSFWYMVKMKGDQIRTEKECNWLQVMYYARELGRSFGRLIFVSKDDLCIQEYVQPLDTYWLDKLAREIEILRSFWVSGILPAATPRCWPKKDGSFAECGYCPYLTTCNKLEGKNDEPLKPD